MAWSSNSWAASHIDIKWILAPVGGYRSQNYWKSAFTWSLSFVSEYALKVHVPWRRLDAEVRSPQYGKHGVLRAVYWTESPICNSDDIGSREDKRHRKKVQKKDTVCAGFRHTSNGNPPLWLAASKKIVGASELAAVAQRGRELKFKAVGTDAPFSL